MKMSKSIDVLFIHHLPEIGGATQSLLGILLSANHNNLTSKVLFLRKQGSAIEFYREEGIDVITNDSIYTYAHAYGAYRSFISRKPLHPITHLIRSFLSVKRAREILIKENPKAVYLNTSVLIPFAIAAKRLNIKVIWHLREQLHSGNIGFRKNIFRYLFKNFADKIIAISKTNADILRVDNVKIIYNSVNFEEFNEHVNPSIFKSDFKVRSRFIVTFLGGKVQSKGADIFVKSAIEVLNHHQDITFIIAGDFNVDPNLKLSKMERKVLSILEQNSELRYHFLFTGSLTKVFELLAATDILIWPATKPHFARPIMEAMVMGVPVIASNYKNSSEILDNNVEGILVKPNANNFANGILDLLNNESLRIKLGKKSRIKAEKMFDANNNNQEIINIIKSEIS